MKKQTNKYNKSIFIFRRDYRLVDNTGLIKALELSKNVIPLFIFTPEQLVSNKYKSDNAVQFMIESLEDLNDMLKNKKSRLFYFYGKPSKVLNNIINNVDIDAVFVNADYTPYSIKRDKEIEKVCNDNGIEFHSYEDVLLNPIRSILTGQEDVYTKFTPYFNKAKKIKPSSINLSNKSNYVSGRTRIRGEFTGNKDKFFKYNSQLAQNGGRKEALKILKKIKQFKNYNKERNILIKNTTRLSAYIKFGCVSIREVYYTFKKYLGLKNDLIKQLYWRDFYYNIGYEFPRIYKKYGNLKEKYDKIKWLGTKSNLNKWKQGLTGYPIVDAAMRELNETGFMHNRGRLIVSNFLIKILLINWQDGEKYFSNKLIDIDPSVNLGNWGWSAGSGADSQPYFRIFNPWTQGEKFDQDAKYIKKWIPELQDVDAEHIHKWYDHYNDYDVDYPAPIVDYSSMRKKALKMYKKALY